MGGGGSKCNKCCEYTYVSQNLDVNGCNWEQKCTDMWGWAGAAARDCNWERKCKDTWGWAGAATRDCNWEQKCTDMWGWAGAATRDCNWEQKCTDTWGWKMNPCPDGLTDRGAFCDRQAHSIAMSYIPESYRNGSVRYMDVVPKGSHTRKTALPTCPPCQKEYSWVLGTCYDDCNITAGIASCVGGQVVKNTGKENFNYSMQSTGLCNLDCPSGSTDMGTYCTVKPENRGAGTALECSGRWQQYGLACYTPCNEFHGIADWNGTSLVKRPGYEYVNYEMQTAGLCAQQCPPGSFDSGVFCNRQSYSRSVGKVKGK